MIQTIEYELIRSPNRIRKVDMTRVDAIAASISEIGLLNPITVVPAQIAGGSGTIDGYNVVAGSHRLAAFLKLSIMDIPCNVLDLGEQERIIAECDENLCVARLTPMDEAVFTAKRKEAYLALHPETAAGVAGAKARHTDSEGDSAMDKLSTASFADDQAAKTGKDSRTVRRQASRGEAIIDAVHDLIRGTALDVGTYLDKLKKVDPAEQEARVREDLEKLEAKEAAKASSPAPKGDAPSDPPAPVRPKSPFANLEREALEDDLTGALERIQERDATIENLRHENDRLKAHIADLSSDNQGAVISKLERQRITLKGSLQDAMAATKREEFKRRRAEDQAAELRLKIENQLIPL